MKRINSIFFAAVAAAFSLVSCSQETLAPTEKPQGELVTVHFGAESGIASSTKATITTEDEATFKSAWENEDVLSVEYLNGQLDEGVVPAVWTGSYFKADLPNFQGNWDYDALYPAPSSTGTVDFGSDRTQSGNEYNSQYDLMFGDASADDAMAGKDDSGKDIVFKMNRQTAIAYFRLTSELDEDVVSAKLSVEGDNAYIATNSAKLPAKYSDGYVFAADATNGLKEITITFKEGTAPKASELKLWFNVLPTDYTSMKLEVETTGHKLTLNNKKQGSYIAANLYKVVKTISTSQWVAKTAPVTEMSYKVEFNSTVSSPALIKTTTNASTFVVSGTEYVTATPFSLVTNAYYGGNSKSGLPLRVGKSDAAGSVTIALSDKGKVEATKIVLSAKQYSSGKTKTIGVNGSAKQQPGDDYTDLTFALDGKPLQSIKLDTDGYIYVKSITVVYPEPTPTCAMPVITIDGAVASIDCATDGAEIHYTVGESPADPTVNDAVYSSPITLTEGQTIKAIAVKDGLKSSAVVSKKFVVDHSVEVAFDYSKLYSSITNSKDLNDVSDVVDGVSISYKKVSGNNSPKYYDNGKNLRIYNKSLMTINVPTGKKLLSVDFSQGTTTWVSQKMSADHGEVDDSKRIWVADDSSSSSSVVLTVTDSFRFTKIVVKYE